MRTRIGTFFRSLRADRNSIPTTHAGGGGPCVTRAPMDGWSWGRSLGTLKIAWLAWKLHGRWWMPALRATGRRRAGFSLLELVVVLAIILIAALIGAGSIQPYLPRFRMVSVAKRMQSDLRMLQSLAMQTGRQARMRLVAPVGDCGDHGAWGGGWVKELGNRSAGSTDWDVLPPDALADGRDDDQSTGVYDFSDGGNHPARNVCLNEWDAIAGPGAGSADSLVFSPRGSLANPVTDFPDGTIRITLSNQAAAREGVTDQVHVVVSAAGWTGLESTQGVAATDGTVGASTSSEAY